MLSLVGYQSRETGDDSGRSSLAADQTIDDKIADTLNTYRFVYGQTREQYEKKQNTIGRMPKHVYRMIVVKGESGGTGFPDNHEDFCPGRKYTDLDLKLWYHGAVDYVLEKRYFQGTSETTFEPGGTMTRAMFVTVLSRMDGIRDAPAGQSAFTDVSDGQWYAEAVGWASRNGIVLGVGGGRFDPDGEITREQMAVILYRYAKYRKTNLSVEDRTKYEAFADKEQVSPWAEEAMCWAVPSGIVNGMDDQTLAPGKSAVRCQVAQLIRNYDQWMS